MQTSDWGQAIWHNIVDYLTDVEVWSDFATVILKLIVIYIAARIAIVILKRTIERLFGGRISGKARIPEKRAQTLTGLLNSIVVNVVSFIAILLILEELGFPLGSLLLGAGVVGLAIGFGAQNLVRDVITGFFIIFEDQFSVGDFIETGKYKGTVLEIGLRVTKIKEFTGQVHIIPNGQINDVTNFSKENSVAVLDVDIAYEENIAHAEEVLQNILKEIKETDENIVADPVVVGVQDLADSSVIIRVTAECKPMTHWGVARKFRRSIKDGFDQAGIEIPYPRMVTYRREEA